MLKPLLVQALHKNNICVTFYEFQVSQQKAPEGKHEFERTIKNYLWLTLTLLSVNT